MNSRSNPTNLLFLVLVIITSNNYQHKLRVSACFSSSSRPHQHSPTIKTADSSSKEQSTEALAHRGDQHSHEQNEVGRAEANGSTSFFKTSSFGSDGRKNSDEVAPASIQKDIQQQNPHESGDSSPSSAFSLEGGEQQHSSAAAVQTLGSEFITSYLKEFGYLKRTSMLGPKNEDDLQQGIKNFQYFVGLPTTGELDSFTMQQLMRRRCSNPDVIHASSSSLHVTGNDAFAKKIWHQTLVNWTMVMPSFESDEDQSKQQNRAQQQYLMRRLIRQAFSAWEIVIALDFVEIDDPSTAHIVIQFVDGDNARRYDNWTEKEASAESTKEGPIVRTGLGIAAGSLPDPQRGARIWLNRDEFWPAFQSPSAQQQQHTSPQVDQNNKPQSSLLQNRQQQIDPFFVIVHEIGHTLGLQHSFQSDSIMHPLFFDRQSGTSFPVISNDDVEHLRQLYASENEHPGGEIGPSQSTAGRRTEPGESRRDGEDPLSRLPLPRPSVQFGRQQIIGSSDRGAENNCPDRIDSATKVNNNLIVLFRDGLCWFLTSSLPFSSRYNFNNNGGDGSQLPGKEPKTTTAISGPYPINQIFPDGPDHVDVAVSSGPLTTLIRGRMVFGYYHGPKQQQNHLGQNSPSALASKSVPSSASPPAVFIRASGFPRLLNSFVLFYPRSAFPMANGSVVLIRDRVFATYNLDTNKPSLFGDKTVEFPGLPDDLRAGIPDRIGVGENEPTQFSPYYSLLGPDFASRYDMDRRQPLPNPRISIDQWIGCGQQIENKH